MFAEYSSELSHSPCGGGYAIDHEEDGLSCPQLDSLSQDVHELSHYERRWGAAW